MISPHSSLSPASVRFFDAVYNNQLNGVRFLTRREKVDPDTIDVRQPSRPTALIYACENQLIELARTLLKAKPQGADVNKADGKGRRPIWWAAQHGNVELAELLIKEFKCEVDYMDSMTGCTPLYRAIVTESAEVCTLLIHGGANVNLRRLGYNTGAESPLMKAVQMDNLEICKVLVNSLCDLGYKTEEGFTALHYAVAYRRYSIVEFLLESGMDKHTASHSGVTAMSVAIEHFNPAMVRCLIRYGYNMNKSYSWKERPLEQAISLHNQECALVLVHWGCTLTPLNYLTLAADAGLTRLVKLLVYAKPSYLNTEWIKLRDWPLALHNKMLLCDWLEEISSSPLSLKQLCRSAIFHHTPYFPKRYTRLPLSHTLLNYISFNDLVDDRMYKHRPLVEQCPIDCHFHHASEEVQCPDIEISDIDGETDYESDDDSGSEI